MPRYPSWPTTDQGNIVGTRLANELYHRFTGGLNALSFTDQKDAALAELLATTPVSLNVKSFGAKADGVTDDTAAIQATLDYAFTQAIGGVVLPDGTYVIFGTLTIPAGVTLFGNTSASEYFPAEGSNAIDGAELLKPLVGSTAGPIVQMTTAAGLRSVYLKHLLTNGATTGIIQMGAVGTAVTCYNTKILDVRMYGDPTTDVTGTNTCYGIYFPQSITTAQRYFNSFHSVYITFCDVAVHLDEESNANNFTGIITRQCYHMYELDGNTGACVDNTFTGLSLINIGSLPTTQEKCFVLKNSTQWNSFVGYQTEINGQAFDIDATSTLNLFVGQENEPDASFVPVGGIAGPTQGGIHSRFQRPLNVEQYSQTLLPILTTGNKFDQIIGSRFHNYQVIDDTGDGLPALNGAGTLVAATAHSRSIIQFNSAAYKKVAEPNFRCKLTLFVNATGSSGQTMVTVEFSYITTNTSTNAGLLSVHRVDLNPAASNFISGLKFIDGATGSTEFRIAVVGGNVSAALAARLVVSLEITHYKLSQIATNDYVNNGFLSTAATDDDVTDAIDLLTVAETVV